VRAGDHPAGLRLRHARASTQKPPRSHSTSSCCPSRGRGTTISRSFCKGPGLINPSAAAAGWYHSAAGCRKLADVAVIPRSDPPQEGPSPSQWRPRLPIVPRSGLLHPSQVTNKRTTTKEAWRQRQSDARRRPAAAAAGRGGLVGCSSASSRLSFRNRPTRSHLSSSKRSHRGKQHPLQAFWPEARLLIFGRTRNRPDPQAPPWVVAYDPPSRRTRFWSLRRGLIQNERGGIWTPASLEKGWGGFDDDQARPEHRLGVMRPLALQRRAWNKCSYLP